MSDRLVLASKSRIRAQLLSAAGLTFHAVDSGLDERVLKHGLTGRGAPPREIAAVLAEAKAKTVALREDGWVIGADQTLDLQGRLLDKPENADAVRAQLLQLRGRSHLLHSAVVVARAGDIQFEHVETAILTVRDFSDAWLDLYLERNGAAVLSSVGGYQLEAEGVQMFESVSGDFFTVLGLPLVALLGFFRDAGVMIR